MAERMGQQIGTMAEQSAAQTAQLAKALSVTGRRIQEVESVARAAVAQALEVPTQVSALQEQLGERVARAINEAKRLGGEHEKRADLRLKELVQQQEAA